MKQHDPATCVCHEPELVARAWQKIRAELGVYVLHHDRQRVFDIIAHELAEQIREDAKARHDRDYSDNRIFRLNGAQAAADLIDPETQP